MSTKIQTGANSIFYLQGIHFFSQKSHLFRHVSILEQRWNVENWKTPSISGFFRNGIGKSHNLFLFLPTYNGHKLRKTLWFHDCPKIFGCTQTPLTIFYFRVEMIITKPLGVKNNMSFVNLAQSYYSAQIRISTLFFFILLYLYIVYRNLNRFIDMISNVTLESI